MSQLRGPLLEGEPILCKPLKLLDPSGGAMSETPPDDLTLLSHAGNRPADWPLHIVYGIFAVLFLPGLYFYAHGGSRSREAVFLAGACWVVAVAYFRGISTG